ncbi:hypothetical protein BKH43_03555 [Helicobacter sp. 13S00401-1]|uniref:hypothetical protein n=1 Tax=Helicobacter sp. 13S00401-1 TaxID=1905758 RepID=UPI000BA659CD|nr:hypothetical protein [Helicobacter sp. 13S00401-1]PAF50943.1 hypothetical protein BKH43_03555 [Helicobacter sp. 13S00401-1]
MKKVTKQAYKKASKIILATTLIASFSSMAVAAEGHKRLRHSEIRSEANNDISGVKFLLGAGVGTGLSAQTTNGGFTLSAPNAGVDAKLKLGTGIFTTGKASTLGLQATIGVGANSLGASSSFNPQYFINLDFIQAFKVGATGYVKLGYILGAGLAIRTHDNVNSGSGNFSNSGNGGTLSGATSVAGATAQVNSLANLLSKTNTDYNNALGAQTTATSSFTTANTAFTLANQTNQTQTASVQAVQNTVSNYQSQLATLNQNINTAKAAINNDNATIAQQKGILSSLGAAPTVSISNNQIRIATQQNSDAWQALGNACTANCSTNPSGPHFEAATKAAIAAQQNLENIKQQAAQQLAAYNKWDSAQKAANDAIAKAQQDIASNNSQIQSLTTQATNLQNGQLATAQTQLQIAQGQLQAAQQSFNEAKGNKEAAQKALDDAKTKVATTKTNLDKLSKELQDAKDALSAIAAGAANKSSAQAAAEEAARRANSAATILPTAKVGLVAFFGKHQAVSLEYQYYFRNTVQGMASSDISLNYTYYFGGK